MNTCHASNRPPKTIIYLLAVVLAWSSLIYTGCGPEDHSENTSSSSTYFPIKVGDATLKLQLSITLNEKQKGLMHRDKLEENSGMLFLFERPARQHFWMKNTQLPLDIGYFDASGRLVEVYPLYPLDETPVPSRSDRILIAIETNRFWFAENGVRPGALIDIQDLKAAIRKRGFDPATFPIEE